MRPNPPRLAILGVTPFSLLLGRACCLADRPPLGLYDPDPQRALEGALHLGISAFPKPRNREPWLGNLGLVLVGRSDCEGLAAELAGAHPTLLRLSLDSPPGNAPEPGRCHLCLTADSPPLGRDIVAELPRLRLKLAGDPAAEEAARAFLEGLSPAFSVLPSGGSPS